MIFCNYSLFFPSDAKSIEKRPGTTLFPGRGLASLAIKRIIARLILKKKIPSALLTFSEKGEESWNKKKKIFKVLLNSLGKVSHKTTKSRAVLFQYLKKFI